MTIIRIKHNRENPYVTLNKQPLFDESLTLKAKGLWAQCLARPDDWKFHLKEMEKRCKEGRRAIYSAIEELIKNDYAIRMEHYEKSEDGKFCSGGVEYIFFEFKVTPEEKEHHIEEFKKSFRRCGFGNARNGDSRNVHLLSKEDPIPNKKDVSLVPPVGRDEKENKPTRKIYDQRDDSSAEAKEIALELWNCILKLHPKAKAPNLFDWNDAIDKAIRLDKRTPEELRAVIKYAFEVDAFWAKTLQSAEGLRRNFDKIWLKMKPIDTQNARVEKNREIAFKIKKALGQSGDEKLLAIYKNSVTNQNTGDSIFLDLNSERFEEVLLTWTGLKRRPNGIRQSETEES